MMRKAILLAASAVVAIEGVAYACSCANTDDPTQLRAWAKDAANNGVALVEAEVLTAYSPSSGGEQMRVTRILAGNAPTRFEVEREPSPSSASCDDLYQVGQRKVMILYPSEEISVGNPIVRTSGLCTALLLEKPLFRDAVAAQLGGPNRGTERG